MVCVVCVSENQVPARKFQEYFWLNTNNTGTEAECQPRQFCEAGIQLVLKKQARTRAVLGPAMPEVQAVKSLDMSVEVPTELCDVELID